MPDGHTPAIADLKDDQNDEDKGTLSVKALFNKPSSIQDTMQVSPSTQTSEQREEQTNVKVSLDTSHAMVQVATHVEPTPKQANADTLIQTNTIDKTHKAASSTSGEVLSTTTNTPSNANNDGSDQTAPKMTTSILEKKVMFEILTTPPECLPVMVLSPKKWRMANDEWMHLIMRAAMNDEDLPGIPSMASLKEGTWSEVTKKQLITPTWAYVVKYDLHIKTQPGEDLVKVAQTAIALWFTKVKEIDRHAIIYPWSEKDWKAKEKSIEQAKDIPYLLSNMKKYFNKLFIKAKGGTYYPQTIIGIMEPLIKIVENIGWWLQHTK